MLDINLIRKDREAIEKKLRSKDSSIDLTNLCELDQHRRDLQTKVQQLKATRNEISQKIGTYKREGKDTSELMEQVAGQGAEIHAIDHELADVEAKFDYEISLLPNLPMDDVLISEDPKDNVLIKERGQKPVFSFPFKNHVELNEKLDLFDFKRGAKVSGTGWPAYKGM